MGGGLSYVKASSINQLIVYFGESSFAIAVNLFIAISGYFLVDNTKRNGWRVVELILQVILFNVGFYLLRCVTGRVIFSARSFLGCCLPVNYYAVLYCVLYLVSPYLNVVINRISIKELKRLVCFSMVLFSVIPTGVDVLIEITGNTLNGLSPIGINGSQSGYTIVNFGLLYLLGAYIRRTGLEIKMKRTYVWCAALVCVFLLTGWVLISNRLGYGNGVAWEYCNPVLILTTCLVLIGFLEMNIGRNRMINALSKATFTVFLLHSYFFRFLNVEALVNANPFLMCLRILGSAMAIYLVCWVVDFIYRKTVLLLLSVLEERFSLSYKVGDDFS